MRALGACICDVCGKLHRREIGNMYKLKIRGITYHFCGYICYNRVLTLKEDGKYEEISEIFNQCQRSDCIH